MIYYPTINPNGPMIDTDSADFKARIQWICDHLYCGYPAERTYINSTPAHVNDSGVSVPGMMHEYLNMEFSVSPAAPAQCDAWVCSMSPKTAVNGIAGMIGRADLQVLGPDYAPPPPPANDWEVPGTHIGYPLAGTPGRYQYLWTGERVGDIIIGAASGLKYTLVIHPGIFVSYEWKVE